MRKTFTIIQKFKITFVRSLNQRNGKLFIDIGLDVGNVDGILNYKNYTLFTGSLLQSHNETIEMLNYFSEIWI